MMGATCLRAQYRAVVSGGAGGTLIPFLILRTFDHSSKGHSLYQISSKMLPGSKVITLVEKKEKRWPGWD